MPPRKRLGQLLTELGVIDEHQLQSALGHQKQWGGKLGAVLVQKGFCNEAEVVSALSKHLSMPSVKLAETKVDERAVKFVSRQIAEKLHVFPYEVTGAGRAESVSIAMSDPTDLSAVDQLAFHTGKRIKPVLAGDSEIVRAIQEHYGDDKKAAAAPGAPPASPAAARPAAPAPSGTDFPKRVAPLPVMAPPAASTRATPVAGVQYIPKAIPAQAPEPEQQLEEIEPEEPMAEPPAPAEPLDLPPDDGEMMGLEPIAAHSQFGDEVAGQETVAGEGSAADVVEGLESASVAHEGAEEAAQMDGLEPIAAHAQEAAPEDAWVAPAHEGWQAEPAAPAAEPGGWGDESAAAEAPAGDVAAGEGWSAAPEPAEGWSAEAQPAEAEPAAEAEGWGAEQAWGAGQPAEAAATDASGGQLPVDAILGMAEAPEAAVEVPAWGEEATAGAEVAPEEAAHEAVAESPVHELALEAAPAPHETAAEDAAAEAEVPEPIWEEAPPEEPVAAEGAAAPEEAAPAEPHFAEEPPEEAASAHASAEAPDAWASSEDPLAAQAEAPAWGEGAPPEQAWADVPARGDAPSQEVAPSTDKFALTGAAAPASVEPAPAELHDTAEFAAIETLQEEAVSHEEPAHEAAPEEAAPPVDEVAASEDVSFEDSGEPAEAPAATTDEQGELKLEGWIAPPPEPEPQGAGWFGQALEATTPLSAADLGTLAAVGIDPNDGVGALRLLATLVRVLNRHQLLDPGELANEVRLSRSQAAAEHAAAEGEAGDLSESGPSGSSGEQPLPADPAET